MELALILFALRAAKEDPGCGHLVGRNPRATMLVIAAPQVGTDLGTNSTPPPAHNPEVAGSNPVPATSGNGPWRLLRGPFSPGGNVGNISLVHHLTIVFVAWIHPLPISNAAACSAASRSSFRGHGHRSAENPTSACPIRSLSTFGLMPAFSAPVAYERRRSWKVMRESAAARRSNRCLIASGCGGRPSLTVNT